MKTSINQSAAQSV